MSFLRYVVTIHEGRKRILKIVDAKSTDDAKAQEQALQAQTKKPPHYASPMPEPYRNYCRYCGRVYRVQDGDELRAYRLLEKHEGEHARRAKYFKPLSVVRPIAGQYAWEWRWDPKNQATTGIGPKDPVIYLGELANMHGHCAVATRDGRVVWALHPDEFELVPEDDL